MSTLYPINSVDNYSVVCGLAIDEALSTYSAGGTGVSGSRRLVGLPMKWSSNALHSIRRNVVGSRNRRVCTCDGVVAPTTSKMISLPLSPSDIYSVAESPVTPGDVALVGDGDSIDSF